MTVTVFKETWLHLLRSTKNRLTIVLVLLGLLAYVFLLLPQLDGFNTVDLDKLERNTRTNQGIMNAASEDGNFDLNMFTGKSAYVDSKRIYENNQALLAAIKNGDVARYSDASLPQFHYEDLYENNYVGRSMYPMKDYQHDLNKYSGRVASYDNADLSFNMLQEKTAWQQIQLLVHDWGPTFFIVLGLFIAADVFVFGIRKRTQRIGVPFAWGRYLFIQSLAVLSFLLIFFLVIGLVFFLAASLLFGTGSLDWQVVQFTYNDMPELIEDIYPLVSIGSFLLQTLPFFLMMLYLFTRLSVLFSLIFRQGVVVFVAGLFTFIFERLYFSRTTRDLFGIDVSKFPQTYFDFTKVISGEKNFLLNTETISVDQGLIIMLLTIVAVEVALAVAVHFRTRQRFIQ